MNKIRAAHKDRITDETTAACQIQAIFRGHSRRIVGDVSRDRLVIRQRLRSQMWNKLSGSGWITSSSQYEMKLASHRARSATMIQCTLRTKIALREVEKLKRAAESAKRNLSARIIQSATRSNAAVRAVRRERIWKYEEDREVASETIQRIVRGYLCTITVQLKSAQLHRVAALLIQQGFRCHRARTVVMTRKAVKEEKT